MECWIKKLDWTQFLKQTLALVLCIASVMNISLQTVEAARAEAERIKRIGEADAYSVEAVGKAEAESMKLKAQAYKQYGEAAIMSMVLESLPQVSQLFSYFPLFSISFLTFIHILYSWLCLCLPLPCSIFIDVLYQSKTYK